MQHLQPNTTLQGGKYRIERVLGQGGLGRVLVISILILFPILVMAQASGGQIRRHSHTQQAEHSNVNRQRTANLHNRDNAQQKRSLPTGRVNGYDAIDLGLSVRWAKCNIGASYPGEFGGLYAYGDPTGKRFTKEVKDYPGGKTIIDSDNDMAKSLWGKDWRLPSEKELRELKEKCSWQYVDQGRVKGYRVTGPNGSSIFFPLAGYMPFSSRQEDGSYGYYWSGESPNDHYAFALVLCGGSYVSVESGSNYVYCGMSVRAVTN